MKTIDVKNNYSAPQIEFNFLLGGHDKVYNVLDQSTTAYVVVLMLNLHEDFCLFQKLRDERREELESATRVSRSIFFIMNVFLL